MTAADDAHDRSHQGIAHWAEHGVQEYEERQAAERAEKGDPEEPEPRIVTRSP
ncbi:MAG TPA: hypothetical protein VIU11_01390 [Nakamurella sp.]